MDVLLDVPTLPSVPVSDMPDPLLERNCMQYEFLLDVANNFPRSCGIIVNTFDSLEHKIIGAISDGIFIPNQPTPPIFCLGPLIASNSQTQLPGRHECLKWLDKQPKASVVLLCFGSLGLLSAEQSKETPIGLERSEQKLLWVVRNPPSKDKTRRFLPPPDPDLNLLLPEGFLDRTKDRGLVVKSWVPQVEVLSHESVGGFVTHCGWNSVLEAVCGGVPMVAWPLYAEQKFNRLILVEEMKLALPMKGSEDGFVTADEIEKRVRELMEKEEGKLFIERT